MIAYTEDKKRYNLDTNNLIGEGEYGKTYLLNNNKCLKVFNEKISRKDNNSFFNEEAFKRIKALNLKNFYKIYDIYYNRTLTKTSGYLSEYYQSEDIDILTMPVDYTLDNLCILYDSFYSLAENNIYTNDVSPRNVILNSNSITVIDTDMYYINYKSDNKMVYHNNFYDLGELFSWLYMESLKETDHQKRCELIDKIQKIFMPVGTFGVEPVIKKLSKYKYPIDYLKKR